MSADKGNKNFNVVLGAILLGVRGYPTGVRGYPSGVRSYPLGGKDYLSHFMGNPLSVRDYPQA